ncbi:unannotated protein [freshwater metagenome]|uniref:Unannotated protein n=1 Tax=freshwater metagenome TaxID=449393 RepID=A0A6J7RS48_9ZZZZ
MVIRIAERGLRRVGYSDLARRTLTQSPALANVTGRFIGGIDEVSAVAVARQAESRGLLTSLHVRRPPVLDEVSADEHVEAFEALVALMGECGLETEPEISIKLAQFGLLSGDGWDGALARMLVVVSRARANGVRVTVDMEGADEVADTLEAVRILRQIAPDVGIALQAYLHRTEADCAALATEGSRVRLVKGAYGAGPGIAHRTRADIDAAYVRCTRILLEGDGYPMLATHDLRLVRIASTLALDAGRSRSDYEFQMLLGVREKDQTRLVADGARVRVYIPYGPDWYGWFVNRIVERPSNIRLVAHALLTSSWPTRSP